MPESKPLFLHLALLFFALAALGGGAIASYVHAKASANSGIFIPSPRIEADIEARAAYAYDLKTGNVLYSKNADEVLPLASLTKIMTAITAMRQMSATSTVAIGKTSISQSGDNGLLLGERWNLGDLLRFTLIESSNDGASAVAAAFESNPPKKDFVAMMNADAAELGFDQMHFYNETGLDENSRTNGGYGSARDVAKLFDYAVKAFPGILTPTGQESQPFVALSGQKHIAYNTDTALASLPDVIASKTGYTELAGGNLAVEFKAANGDPIIAVVLGSSKEGRFSDMRALAEGAENAFSTSAVSQ